MKGGKAHVLPLSPSMISLLADLPRFGGIYVFTSNNGYKPVSGFSHAKAKLDRIADVEPWRFHDIRRTVRTNLAALGIDPVVAERIMAHRQRGILGTYDQYSYLDEMRDALTMWEARLKSIV
jgi:integrase